MTFPIYAFDHNEAPTLCIQPGNGFPPQMYEPLAEELGNAYHKVMLLPRPWWQGAQASEFHDWHTLASDLIDGIEAHQLAPVLGVGHSMSGVALVIASIQRPELFRGIVLVDPVYLPRWMVRIGAMIDAIGIEPNKGMVNGALRRRRKWDSHQAAYDHFRARSLFKRCSDDMVRRYVEGITTPDDSGNGVMLRYAPEWEAKIFGTTPFYEWKLPPQITVPCLAIGGAQTNVFRKDSVRLWRQMRPDIPVKLVPNMGHLVPFEDPTMVGQLIHQFLNVWLSD